MKEQPKSIEQLMVEAYKPFQHNGSYFTQELLLKEFARLIGGEVLKLANRHGNIKPREVEKYFGEAK